MTTRCWLLTVNAIRRQGGKAMLNAFQSFLPSLPVPSVKGTIEKVRKPEGKKERKKVKYKERKKERKKEREK